MSDDEQTPPKQDEEKSPKQDDGSNAQPGRRGRPPIPIQWHHSKFDLTVVSVQAMVAGVTMALALVGGGDAISTVVRNTIRQMQTPDSIRGRMVSVNQIFFMGGPQLGEVRAGLVGGLIGVPLAIATGGFVCLLSLAWIARRWPQLKAYDGGDPALSLAL